MLSCKKIKVAIENSNALEFYYSYNNKSTVDDLIECIAYYFP